MVNDLLRDLLLLAEIWNAVFRKQKKKDSRNFFSKSEGDDQ